MQEGIDFVRCRICGLESGVLSRHLGTHDIDAGEYVRQYPDAKVVADKVRDARSEKLRTNPKKEPCLVCRYCGAKFEGRVQRRAHERREETVFLNGKEGYDFILCKECGFRDTRIVLHLRTQHDLSLQAYREKYPDAAVVLESVIRKQTASILAKGGFKPVSEKRGAMQCLVCNEWYQYETAQTHRETCVAAYPDKYKLNKDYVKCPECRGPFLRLGKHLRDIHGWDKDKLAIEVGRGLKLMADIISEKRTKQVDFDAVQKKREQTHLKRHGYANPFANPEVQKKIVETNQRRYGASHAMRNEEVFARQSESAHRGPSEQEKFFDEHTCENVVYVGYGGRFIRTKTGVHKYGRLIKDLNPDFMVLPRNVLESALAAVKEHRLLDRQKHRSKYVIELLGDYYHSKEVIGVEPAEHEKELVEAYKSVGIECLVLWEKDIMTRWESIRLMVDAWIEKAVADMNENPIWSRATKDKVDRRKGDLVCPYGSGKRFKSHKQLQKWMESPLNYWKSGLVEGRDYVLCLECGTRVAKVTEHIRKSHSMTKDDYLVKHPAAKLVSARISKVVSEAHIGMKCGKAA